MRKRRKFTSFLLHFHFLKLIVFFESKNLLRIFLAVTYSDIPWSRSEWLKGSSDAPLFLYLFILLRQGRGHRRHRPLLVQPFLLTSLACLLYVTDRLFEGGGHRRGRPRCLPKSSNLASCLARARIPKTS